MYSSEYTFSKTTIVKGRSDILKNYEFPELYSEFVCFKIQFYSQTTVNITFTIDDKMFLVIYDVFLGSSDDQVDWSSLIVISLQMFPCLLSFHGEHTLRADPLRSRDITMKSETISSVNRIPLDKWTLNVKN